MNTVIFEVYGPTTTAATRYVDLSDAYDSALQAVRTPGQALIW